ncbi:MAG: SRPBCC family protein, partial [Gemmatimonadota bacterium]|nr:SRPBCC family protein [Gemmatimonadota bacterium]
VWAYLTEPEKRRKWLAAGKMELREGGAVTLEFQHRDLSAIPEPTPDRYRQYDAGSTMNGRITRCEPPRILAFTWVEGVGESHVTFELTPKGKDVTLVLTHERLPNRTEMIGISGGWHTHLEILEDELRGRDRRPFWSTHLELEEQYEQRIP